MIWFFDEISLAPEDMRGAVLGILEEHRQGDIQIPDDWIIVAAGNRPEDLANARSLGAAANRRLLYIVIEPQLEATLAHFVKTGVAPEVLAFLKVFPQHLSGEESARQQKHELYPRPASWKKVSDICGELRKADKNMRHLAIAGIIGDSAATEFIRKIANLTRSEFTHTGRWSCENLYYLDFQDDIRTSAPRVKIAARFHLVQWLKNQGAAGERIIETWKLEGRRSDLNLQCAS